MAILCDHCGECAVDEEDEVCHNCGVVSEGFRFDDTCNPFCSDTKTTLHLYPQKKITVGLDYGIAMLNMLSHKYSVSADIKGNATDLLKEAYVTKSFKSRSDIGVLAGCCLIHFMKQNNIYVTIIDLCKKLKCAKKTAFKYDKFLRAYLSKQSPVVDVKCEVVEVKCKVEDVKCGGKNIKCEVENVKCGDKNIKCEVENVKCGGKNIKCEVENVKCKVEDVKCEVGEMTFENQLVFSTRSILESVSVENKEELIKKTIALTKLAHSCWLISGRSPEGVICASAYLCVKSMNRSLRNLSFNQFCKDFSMPYSKALLRVGEIKDLLFKLGQNIPSFSKNYVTKKNVLFHLDYILENSETLRNDLLPDEFTTEEVDKKEFSSFRRVFKKVSKMKQYHPTEKKPDYKDNMQASDVEISDTEISSYIRSDEQVKMIMSLKKKSTYHNYT